MRRVLAVAVLVAALAAPLAALKFQRLAEDRFIVAAADPMGRPTIKATKKAYAHAASVCQAAGYQYLEIVKSSDPTWTREAKVEFRVYREGADGRIDCAENADPKIVEQAKKKLAKAKADQ